jgi:hypothetical protein
MGQGDLRGCGEGASEGFLCEVIARDGARRRRQVCIWDSGGRSVVCSILFKLEGSSSVLKMSCFRPRSVTPNRARSEGHSHRIDWGSFKSEWTKEWAFGCAGARLKSDRLASILPSTTRLEDATHTFRLKVTSMIQG